MKPIYFLSVILAAQATFAEGKPKVKCQVDKAVMGGKKKDVPVTIVKGAEVKKITEVQFEGQRFSVVWNLGDEFEKQNRLTMNLGDFESSLYNFDLDAHKAILQVVTKKDLRFQCWIE